MAGKVGRFASVCPEVLEVVLEGELRKTDVGW